MQITSLFLLFVLDMIALVIGAHVAWNLLYAHLYAGKPSAALLGHDWRASHLL